MRLIQSGGVNSIAYSLRETDSSLTEQHYEDPNEVHDPNEPAKVYPSMMDWYYRNPVDGDLLCKDGL